MTPIRSLFDILGGAHACSQRELEEPYPLNHLGIQDPWF